MRNDRRWITGLGLMAVLAFPGCLEKYEVTTMISTDGTVERKIVVRRDSKRLPDAAFPVPADSSWTLGWTEQTVDPPAGDPGKRGTEHVYTATKRFADFDALTREYRTSPDPGNLAIDVRVEERFRWFYTYYVYTETYRRFDPHRDPLQPSDFLTAEEIRRFQASEKPDSILSTRWKQWEERKDQEWAFGRFVELVRRAGDPALPPELFERNKERLIRAFIADSTREKGGSRRTQDRHSRNSPGERGREHQDVLELLARELGTGAVFRLGPVIDTLTREYVWRDSVSSRADGAYTNTVILPGVILETNAREVRGTTTVWRFTHEHLALADYTMTVESRVVNLWPMVLSGLLVLAAVLIPVFRRRW
jgi:hypothetical protein